MIYRAGKFQHSSHKCKVILYLFVDFLTDSLFASLLTSSGGGGLRTSDGFSLSSVTLDWGGSGFLCGGSGLSSNLGLSLGGGLGIELGTLGLNLGGDLFVSRGDLTSGLFFVGLGSGGGLLLLVLSEDLLVVSPGLSGSFPSLLLFSLKREEISGLL